MTRAELAAQFDREEQAAAESIALEQGIRDAGGWHAYLQLRDGDPHTNEERSA